MKNKQRTLLVLILVLVIVFAVSMFAYRALSSKYPADPETSQEENVSADAESGPQVISRDKLEQASDFTLEDNEGNSVSLSDHLGKPVVINFWATWCPHCVKELPYFQEAYEKYSDHIDFMMIDLTDGQRETKELAREYIEEYEYTFPLYFDTEFSAVTAYAVSAIPVTICITQDGYIYSTHMGAIDKLTLNQWVKTLAEDAAQ